MRKTVLTASVLAVLAAVPAMAESVDDVISRHIEARGGRAAWDAVETMKVSGSFTSFSVVSPFTLQRKRDDRFHLDYVWNDKPVILGYDGKLAWWNHGWYQEGVLPVTGQDLFVVMGDVHFATPLFDYAKRGYTAELIGETEMDGIPAIGIKLTRPDEQEETWFLDPKTHLEMGRESPGSDFGNPAIQRTFYDDFRTVEGLVIPHLTEAQWYTRDRVMRIETIEINGEIDDSVFVMPPRLGMEKLASMVGEWDVKLEQRGRGDQWSESSRSSRIGSVLNGGLLEERYTNGSGSRVVRTLSYDRHRKSYRLTRMDEASTWLDVREGVFDDDGKLVVSNLETGTPDPSRGDNAHQRLSFSEIGDDTFKVEWENTDDGGENWAVVARATYTRKEP